MSYLRLARAREGRTQLVAFNSTHGVSAVPADDCEQHIAFRDALIQHANKVEAGSYIIDVQKKLIGLKLVLQPIEQAACVAGIIAAAVVEEYFADHRAYLVDAVTKAKSVTVAPRWRRHLVSVPQC
jgi:hypothetical protein